MDGTLQGQCGAIGRGAATGGGPFGGKWVAAGPSGGLSLRNRRQVLAGLAALLAVPAGGAAAATAADAAAVAAWQRVITLQIEAFRRGDAETAYAYAGSAFKSVFSSASVFFLALTRSRYAIIAGSRAHRFGSHVALDVAGNGGVVQEVTVIGAHGEGREALYFMRQEPEGWRVQGVVVLGGGLLPDMLPDWGADVRRLVWSGLVR
jgi:hypothetical protein